MNKRMLSSNVFFVGVMDWDRKLFDELIPLPDGTSYNAYIIKGSEKIALIDTVDPKKKNLLINNLQKLEITHLDYIIANHAEQDHSGSIPDILKLYPEAKVVTNQKCKEFLKELLLIEEEKFIIVENMKKISLGNKTLEFIFTPWTHWPETMCSYLIEDKILFSCDLFGSHRATSSLFVYDEYKTIEDAKRYYAEIMMPFRHQLKRNIEEIERREIKIIAPSHGPVYNNPNLILNAYKEWIEEKVKKKVLIPYVSMHDSTAKIVEYLTEKFIEKGIQVSPINLAVADIGILAMELVDTACIILAAPYVLGGAHPLMVSTAYLINALRPKTKIISIICSYGWGGKGTAQLKDLLSGIKANFLEPLLIKGSPKNYDFSYLNKIVAKVCKEIDNLN